ncbi:MAG: hypothetical protein K8I27_09600 [Planctomycetes bacterium]|nr:hypothetical protein [Planctomycetota bacterium]
MKRSSTFALVALVFLLVVLLGSWVYLKNYPWPPGGAESSGTDGRAARDAHCGGDPFADLPDPDAGNDAGGTGGPLEDIPEEDKEGKAGEVERGRAPESVETRRAGADTNADTTATQDVVEAVTVAGQAGVRGGAAGEEDLEAFVVSTLQAPDIRALERDEAALSIDPRAHRKGASALVPSSKLDGDSEIPGLPWTLVGQLVWPTLTKEARTDLTESARRQAVVYLKRLPEFSVVVHDDEGWFALPVTERMGEDFGREGLEVVVHSPAFQIVGGLEAINHEKNDGALRIQLELAPVFELVVDVSPPEAVGDGVRVWVERLGEPGTPDADDSLYISAKVPSSGRLHFLVPEHYGTLTFGASGQNWHSGLPGRVKEWGWQRSKLKLSVALTLAADQCDQARGQVVDALGEPLKTRLQCTHFGVVAYSGADGTFSMWVPFERGKPTRQFIVARPHHRPEVIPLENRGEPTSGVEGTAPYGPWKVALSATAHVVLDIPKEILQGAKSISVGSSPPVSSDGAKDSKFEMRWGRRVVLFYDYKRRLVGAGLIDADQWEDAFARHAGGSDTAPELEVTTLEDALKKR